MIWIFAAVLIALAALSPRFRKFGLALAGAAIVIIVALILLNDRVKKVAAPTTDISPAPASRQKMMDHDEYLISMQDKKDPDARRRIALAEVRFGEIAPARVAGVAGFAAPSAVFQSVQARLFNDSTRFTLTNYSYVLTVQDCVAERCTTVYEQREQGIPLTVPPTQARDVTLSLKPDPVSGSIPFKLIGKPVLQLTCTDVRAYQTPDGLQPVDGTASAPARGEPARAP